MDLDQVAKKDFSYWGLFSEINVDHCHSPVNTFPICQICWYHELQKIYPCPFLYSHTNISLAVTELLIILNPVSKPSNIAVFVSQLKVLNLQRGHGSARDFVSPCNAFWTMSDWGLFQNVCFTLPYKKRQPKSKNLTVSPLHSQHPLLED